jgi:hypothetical protein
MTGPKNSDRAALDRLTDALVEDVLRATDAEIAAECREDGVDIAAEAKAGRAIFEKARSSLAKLRLDHARQAVAADRQQAKAQIVKFDPEKGRRVLDSVLEKNPGLEEQLTLAARKGAHRSDEDVQSMLEDLAELGILPADDEAGGN